ncbi:MAG: AtpZ/AtpI family protein [Lachnospiraceae bacterium]
MNGKKRIARSLALITQLGISVLVPVILSTLIGLWIDRRFGTVLTIPLLILGILGGAKSAYVLVKNEIELDRKNILKEPEIDLMADWKKQKEYENER